MQPAIYTTEQMAFREYMCNNTKIRKFPNKFQKMLDKSEWTLYNIITVKVTKC